MPPRTPLSVARETHATRRVNVLAILATGVAAGGALLLMRAFSDQLPDAQPVLPVVYALNTCGAALAAFLLAVRSRLHEHRPLAWVALGYGIATVAMALQTLGYPGVLRDGGPLNTTSSGAGALYLIWHLAVPVCALVALRAGHARRPLLFGVAAGFGALTLYASWGGSPLPTIIRADGRYTPLTVGSLYALVALSVVTLVAWLRRLGPRPP